jgi:tripartite-type tricarboxylate transporter receptor subunit TctC
MRIATISRRWAQGLMAAALALMLVPGAAVAQEWPKEKPIKAIVPFGGGSSTDIIARLVLDEVGRLIGQTIVVENAAGAAGTRGSGMVAKADPDGYTLLVHSSSHTVTPSTFSKLPYDTEKDLLPVMPLATIPNVVLVSSKRGYKTLGDLVKAAQAKPGTFNFASAGAGSATHLTAERLKLSAKIEAAHVAFKGSNEALTEILADRIDFYCSPVNAAIGHITQGTMTALAVSSAKRSSALPDVPTTVEAGFPDSGYEFWIGAFLPGKTPEAIRTKLHDAIVKAIGTPAVAERLAKLGADPLKISPQEFEAMIRREIAANAAVVKAAGIKVN